MAAKGYYSLIQYCPDPSRLESANIGVVLLCPELRFLQAKVAGNNRRIAKFFGRNSFDPDAVALAKATIEARLEPGSAEVSTIEDLERLIATRANAVLLTPPRPMRVDDPVEDLKTLYADLVGGEDSKRQHRVAWDELEEVFEQSDLAWKIRRRTQVVLPVLGRKFVAPYAFQNGHLNLIKPVDVPAAETRALQVTGTLALEGDLLQKHPTPENARLIAVLRFRSSSASEPEMKRTVLNLFAEYRIRTFEIEDLPRLAQEIRETAH
ncbi:MAG TPA: DUF3037 domain-containing protein [Vicinamibacterales bacterium]|jgi:hypothetical protein|nr:DUF3037 domain-containing protein [Vicinamibacterales bacterium]